MPRHHLGIPWESISQSESINNNFYLGEYFPQKRNVFLTDSSAIVIHNGWIENNWTFAASVFLYEYKKVIPGYNFYLPISLVEGRVDSPSFKAALEGGKNTMGSNPWPLGFYLAFDKSQKNLTKSTGMGYSNSTGFCLSLDTVPDTLRLIVAKSKVVDSMKVYYHEDKDYRTFYTKDEIHIDTLLFVGTFE